MKEMIQEAWRTTESDIQKIITDMPGLSLDSIQLESIIERTVKAIRQDYDERMPFFMSEYKKAGSEWDIKQKHTQSVEWMTYGVLTQATKAHEFYLNISSEGNEAALNKRLHHAIKTDNKPELQFLVQSGVNIHKKNDEGLSAFEWSLSTCNVGKISSDIIRTTTPILNPTKELPTKALLTYLQEDLSNISVNIERIIAKYSELAISPQEMEEITSKTKEEIIAHYTQVTPSIMATLKKGGCINSIIEAHQGQLEAFIYANLTNSIKRNGENLSVKSSHVQKSINDGLLDAVKKNNHAEMQFLLIYGANINARDAQNVSALMLAATHKDPMSINILLDSRENIDIEQTPDSNENTPLMWACKNKNVYMVKRLLDFPFQRCKSEDPESLEIALKRYKNELLVCTDLKIRMHLFELAGGPKDKEAIEIRKSILKALFKMRLERTINLSEFNDTIQCPILFSRPEDPVTFGDNYVYEREAVLRIISESRNGLFKSPMTREKYSTCDDLISVEDVITSSETRFANE